MENGRMKTPICLVHKRNRNRNHVQIEIYFFLIVIKIEIYYQICNQNLNLNFGGFTSPRMGIGMSIPQIKH